MPSRGLALGRGTARFRNVAVGGAKVCRLRGDVADPTSASEAHVFRDCSIAPLRVLKRRLRAVSDLLRSIGRNGFTSSGGLELDVQWEGVLGAGPVGSVAWDGLVAGPSAGVDIFSTRVGEAIDRITEVVLCIEVHWRTWVLEDPLVDLYKWLRPDLVPPAPFLNCDPDVTPDGSGVLVAPGAIDEQFGKAWLPFFCRGDTGRADLDSFKAVAEGLTPHLDEVGLPPLFLVLLLHDGVQEKKPTGSLDGWVEGV